MGDVGFEPATSGGLWLYCCTTSYGTTRSSLSLRVDRHVRLGRPLQSKASGVSEDHESTPRYAPNCADFSEFSELLERATQDLETVFFLFEERVEQR